MFAEKTTVSVEKTRFEVERLLVRHKTTQSLVAIDDEAMPPLAIVQFKMCNRIVKFVVTLPDPKDRVYSYRAGQVKFDQVKRTRWRALLLVLKAKLESVENHISTFETEFLAHIVINGHGDTVADVVTPAIERAYENGNPSGRFLIGDGT